MLIKKNIFNELSTEYEVHEEEASDAMTRASNIFPMKGSSDSSIKLPAFDKESFLDEARREADEIIEAAQREAGEIINDSKDRLKEEVDKALAKKNAKLDELEQRAIREVEDLLNAERNLVAESKVLIMDLATQLAGKIINKTVKEDSSILENMLQETVDEMVLNSQDNLKVCLLVNEKDLSVAQKFAERMTQKSDNLEASAKADESVSRGSCVLETSSGAIDLNFATQLQLFKERFLATEDPD